MLKLCVENLNYNVTNQPLEKLFANHGTVKSVSIIGSKSFGFVKIIFTEEANKTNNALLDTYFNDRPLKINEAKRQKPGRDFNDNYECYWLF